MEGMASDVLSGSFLAVEMKLDNGLSTLQNPPSLGDRGSAALHSTAFLFLECECSRGGGGRLEGHGLGRSLF